MVGRHEKIIFSVCFFYATSEVPFEDLRQEVLISLFKGYRNYWKNAYSDSGYLSKDCKWDWRHPQYLRTFFGNIYIPILSPLFLFMYSQ